MARSLDEKRDLYFLRQAYKYAHKNSVDPSTHTGVVIVLNYQSIMRGANHGPGGLIIPDEILKSSAKYDWVEHAEQNAVHQAANKGVSLKGGTIYSPWFPCAPCASAIIGAGIIELVTHKELQELSKKLDVKWGDSQRIAAEMFRLKEVKLREVSGRIGDDIPILFKGQIFYL
jgi:dCMP deaminase